MREQKSQEKQMKIMYEYIMKWEENQAYSTLLKSELMDANWYKKYYLVPQNLKDINPVKHYLEIGWKEGKNPSPQFYSEMYLDANKDVRKLDICPLLHYETIGKYEKRKLYSEDYLLLKESGKFNIKWYESQYSSIKKSDFRDAIADYLYRGWKLGRNPNNHFVSEMYLDANPELRSDNICPFVDYLKKKPKDIKYYTREYQILLNSEYFDKDWYVSYYKSVSKSDITDPYAHYLYRGWKEKKEPGPTFSGRMYLEVNKDVDMCPIVHYEMYGKAENRERYTESYYSIKQSKYFDSEWYTHTYLETSEYDYDPVYHYLFWGWRKGYNPSKMFVGDMYLDANNLKNKNMCPIVHYEQNKESGKIQDKSHVYNVIAESKQFDFEWYNKHYMQEETDIEDPLAHYIYRGWKDGNNPNKKFDSKMYLDANKDVKECPYGHYLMKGISEQRNIYSGEYDVIKNSKFFDAVWYLEQYPETKDICEDPAVHYLYHGWQENKNPSIAFDGFTYLLANKDVKKEKMCPLLHYELFGYAENRIMDPENVNIIKNSKYFNALWYRMRYKDVRTSGMRPEVHYLYYGWKEGKNPSPFFDGNVYLNVYSGVKKANVCPLIHYEKCGKEEKRLVFNSFNTPRYKKFGLIRKFETAIGKFFNQGTIKKYENVRILVCLHLFYADAWKEVSDYLKRLNPYSMDLKISYAEYLQGNPILDVIKNEYPNAELILCENRGYDIGPFIKLCEDVDLKQYDIVFKLHTKGITKTRFVYHHYFQQRDWFVYLFEGVLGAFTIHKTIRLLSEENDIGMISAFNLIASDPSHKRKMVEDYFGEKYDENYQFVAGTCFAMRANALEHFLKRGIRFKDFEITERGKFSLAHAVERLICIDTLEQGYRIYGNQCAFIRRLIRLPKKHKYEKMSAVRLLQDDRFDLDEDFFYRTLETKPIYKYEIVDVKLKDIKRIWGRKTMSLSECAPYKYLAEHKVSEYEQYCEYHQENNLPEMSRERYDALINSIENHGFNERNIIVINQDNVIQDGQHRSCCLLYKYGGDYTVKALKVYFLKERRIY